MGLVAVMTRFTGWALATGHGRGFGDMTAGPGLAGYEAVIGRGLSVGELGEVCELP
jgi:hypothetical protein